MTIPDKGDFQPSAETLKKWLATRKPTLTVGGVAMPGFFSDTGNSADTNWLWVAVIGEIAGLVTIFYGGMSNGGEFLALATLGALMFIFCDFFFAQKLHRNKAAQCQIQTEKLLEDDSRTSKKRELDLKLSGGKFTDMLLKSAIYLIALLKVLAILLLGVFNSVIVYIPFVIIFLIVAYVHVNHTGYYFAYISTQNSINREYKLFANEQFKAKEPDQPVETPTALRKLPIKHNPHEIIPDSDKKGNNYLIKTKGILTDDDIISLVAGQEDSNKIVLFKACRKLQIENIEGRSTF